MENQKQRRGGIYVRESTEEQDKGFAPQTQIDGVQVYADKHNIVMQSECHYKDLKSGTSATKRPGFQQMIEDAHRGKFDVLLVYHTSRFARNVKEARHYKELLRRKLGIDVISVTQPFGAWDDPAAFLSEGINELFDEHYSRNLSMFVRNSLATKRRLGSQLGNPPFGYYKKQLGYDEDNQRMIYEKKWLLHEQYAPLILELFTKYATGRYSFADLAEDLNKRGHKTQLGNPFTYSSIKDILNNKAYCGITYSPRKDLPEIPAKHPAIISVDLYEQVQIMIQQRNKTQGRPAAQHRFYLLQGVIYCYKSRHHLHGKENAPSTKKMLPRMYCEHTNSGPIYGCKMRREYRDCDQKDVHCEIIDTQVDKFMHGFSVPEDIVSMTMKKLNDMIPSLPKNPDIETKINKLEEKLKRISRTYADGNLDEATYNADTLEVKNALLALGATPQTHLPQPNTKDFVTSAERLLHDFPTMWDNELPEAKRQWILLTIKRIWIENDKVVAIEPHDKFKKLFPQLQEVLGQAPLATP